MKDSIEHQVLIIKELGKQVLELNKNLATKKEEIRVRTDEAIMITNKRSDIESKYKAAQDKLLEMLQKE